MINYTGSFMTFPVSNLIDTFLTVFIRPCRKLDHNSAMGENSLNLLNGLAY
jgi:hypothetical protein